MDVLPAEVQDMILNQLRIKDLSALLMTSKTMMNVVDQFSHRLISRRNKVGDNALRRVKKTLKWKDFPLTHREMALSRKRKVFTLMPEDPMFHYRCLLLSRSMLNPGDDKMALRLPVDPSNPDDELLLGVLMTHRRDFDTRVGRQVVTIQGKAKRRFIFTYRKEIETSDPGMYEISIHLTLCHLLSWSDHRTISATIFKGPGSNQLKKLVTLKLSPGWQGERFKWWKEDTDYDKVFRKSKGRLKLDCGSVIRLSRQSEYGTIILAPFRMKKKNQTITFKLAVEALQYDNNVKGGGQVKLNFVQLKKLSISQGTSKDKH